MGTCPGDVRLAGGREVKDSSPAKVESREMPYRSFGEWVERVLRRYYSEQANAQQKEAS